MSVDSTLLLIAPQFASIAVETREAVAALAALSVGPAYGPKQELATAYLTAHMLYVRENAVTGGAIKSRKEGDLAITYADNGVGDYSASPYGVEFMLIGKMFGFSARTRTA